MALCFKVPKIPAWKCSRKINTGSRIRPRIHQSEAAVDQGKSEDAGWNRLVVRGIAEKTGSAPGAVADDARKNCRNSILWQHMLSMDGLR
jgi:hypothetical protein